METEPQLDTLIEAAARTIHGARLQAYLEGGYGDALKGAREFIRVVAAEMAAMPAGARRNHLWKAVVLDAERLVHSSSLLTDQQKFVLGQELRLKTQLAISKDVVVQQPTRKKTGRPKGALVDGIKLRMIRGKLSQEKFAAKCGVDLSTIKRAENGDSLDGATIDRIEKGVSRLTARTVDLRKVQKGQK